jgi:hypothetical protein
LVRITLRPLSRPSGPLGRLPASVWRVALLCVFIVIVGMLPWRLTPSDAGRVVLICGIVTALGAVSLVGATKRIFDQMVVRTDSARIVDAVRHLVRMLGLPLLALGFFLFWTFVYVGLWWYRPMGSFSGISARPYFADFFYYSVGTALISPPGDIIAVSRGVRTATMIELLTGFALLTAWLATLLQVRRGDDAQGSSSTE